MSWVTPWFIPWLVSTFGGDIQLALPPLIPNNLGHGSIFDPSISPISGVSQPDAITNDGTVFMDLSILNRCVAPDGVPRVAALAGNRNEEPTLPGPIISGYKGDRFLINVTNDLTDTSMFTGTTIHWHGIFQNRSSQMDGTAYVTQCPISPQESFLYNFTANDQVGTFWYHSHYAVQYCDGLRGAFIIREHPDHDPYAHLYHFDDDSTIITLMDWYHYPSPETPRQIWPDSVLINGTGCYDPQMPEKCPKPATYKVEVGKSYRFRLLNMACKPFYNFTIDNHNLTVIEVDGNYVKPYTVGSIQIHPAQRYSFVLNANQDVGNYWIRAIANPSQHLNASQKAILRYIGAPDEDPTTHMDAKIHLNETLLDSTTPLPPRLVQNEPDERVNVVMNKDIYSDYNFFINGVEYKSPSIPTLMQIMNGTLNPDVDPRESVYILPRDKVVEVTFYFDNTPGRPHPFHLHGHHFAVIKSADSEFRKYDAPVMRDTVNTGFNSTSDKVTIRFITDNPGPWILHCHNEWHLYTGMAIVFVEDIESIRKNQSIDKATWELCPYNNPNETFALPPPRSTAGPHRPIATTTCVA